MVVTMVAVAFMATGCFGPLYPATWDTRTDPKHYYETRDGGGVYLTFNSGVSAQMATWLQPEWCGWNIVCTANYMEHQMPTKSWNAQYDAALKEHQDLGEALVEVWNGPPARPHWDNWNGRCLELRIAPTPWGWDYDWRTLGNDAYNCDYGANLIVGQHPQDPVAWAGVRG